MLVVLFTLLINIPSVFAVLSWYGKEEFQTFVVDDNSDDATSLISKEFSTIVIKNRENIGYEKSYINI